ncbi:MAG: hypothetical protein FWE13_02315 [Firmicutes bacterium]|nr:hypothetical protein [Bacillota bacterium]
MKHWISTIFYLNNKLNKLLDALSQELESYAVNLTIDTFRVFDLIMKIEDKKRRICNFKVLGDLIKSKLNISQKEIVNRYIVKGDSFEQIAYGSGVSKSTTNRRFKEAINIAIATAISLGYNEDKLTKEYCDIMLITKIFRNFMENGVGKVSKEREVSEAV